ncbi:MAG: hypothetical protein DMF89_27280 [Acidobacteria bacterium]|nr:MAG: hypothetical protein DMF89_27280 [Acidobacteriota bacterium]
MRARDKEPMRKSSRSWTLAIVSAAVVSVPAEALADHVVLTNGDSLTGIVAAASMSELVVDTELAGRVTLKWSAVSQLTSTTSVRATLPTGQIVEGAPIVSNGHFAIQPGNGATLPSDLATLRALEMVRATTNAPSWRGSLNSGWDISRGNSETWTISTNGTATRLGPVDRLGAYGAYLFSAIGSGADAVTTARAFRSGLRYDHDLTRPLFGFVFGDVESDPLQLLDLRTVGGGGAGVHVVKTAATQLNLFGGASYARDAYAPGTTTSTTTTSTTATKTVGPPVTPPGQGGTPPGLSGIKPNRGGTPPPVVNTTLLRQVGEFLAGQDLDHQLSDSVNVTESFTVFPAIDNLQDYRLAFDVSLAVQLNGWLQWNVTVADRYLNIPPSGGAIQNDIFLSTGLGITFGRGDSGAYTGATGRRPPPTKKP